MGYQVLARKWRPKQFEDVVGQEHVTQSLQNAIKFKRLAHAYLFVGTRGVGKTSIARLFSKAIRCEKPKENFNPCLQCQSCKEIDSGNSLDYTEIDGASNNSVDGVRTLIENVQYLPSRGQYKIYVIDEVHMLSNSAFNALLKTLEEPPAHTIFILATTDPSKILGTVISRCQRFDFKNVPNDVLVAQINKIAKAEQIEFLSEKIPQKIAVLGKGSVRDTLTIFDQVLAISENKKISEADFSKALGIVADAGLRSIINSILAGDSKNCSTLYQSFLDSNIDLRKFCDQILDAFYNIINSLDSLNSKQIDEFVSSNILKEISLSEIFWIYEVLAKDFQWGLTSINPEKVILVLLQKVCLRRKILGVDDQKIEIKSEEILTSAAEEVTQVKSWQDFLDYLMPESPATATNLAHGNLISDLTFNSEVLTIILGFGEEAAVFKEFLEKKEIYQKLLISMGRFFNKKIENINFQIQLLSNHQKEQNQFRSVIEIEQEIKSNQLEERKQKILNDPYIKEAEKVFNSKIDKIILKDREIK
jgi:DNA polymerase-3 subunit gamma/tau